MSTPYQQTERLATLVAHKHELLRQMRELGCRQMETITSGDLSQLFRILAAKQRLLHALQETEQGLSPYRQDDPERRVWSSPAARQQCQEMMRQCERLLLEIMQQERQSEQDLTLRRDTAAEQLQGLHQAATSHAAYAGDEPGWSGQIDFAAEG